MCTNGKWSYTPVTVHRRRTENNVLSLSRNDNKRSRNSFLCGSSENVYCCKIDYKTREGMNTRKGVEDVNLKAGGMQLRNK